MASKGYYEFNIKTPEELHDVVIAQVSEMGSLGSYEINGDLFVYFEENTEIANICIALDNFMEQLKASVTNHQFSFDYKFLPWQDWNESWKKSFKPIDVGNNLTVVPAWVKPDTERIPIIMDPASAFGTGHHETTRMCMKILEAFADSCKGKTFLDVGTGTGILSICAAKLGFASALGIDTDPMAVEAALKNVELNNLKNVEIRNGIITHVEGTFDFIIANIYYDVLITITREIDARLRPDGIAVFSGMLVSQSDHVIRVAEQFDLALKEKIVDGNWVALIFSNQLSAVS